VRRKSPTSHWQHFTPATTKAKIKVKLKAKAERAASGWPWVHAGAGVAAAAVAGAEIITDTVRRRFSTTLMRRLSRSGRCGNIGALIGELIIGKNLAQQTTAIEDLRCPRSVPKHIGFKTGEREKLGG
jgi:hypothetical protein